MDNDPKKFAMWLHGFLELNEDTSLNEQKLQRIKEYLNLVVKELSPVPSNGVKILYRETEEQFYPKWESSVNPDSSYETRPLCKEYFDPFDYPNTEDK